MSDKSMLEEHFRRILSRPPRIFVIVQAPMNVPDAAETVAEHAVESLAPLKPPSTTADLLAWSVVERQSGVTAEKAPAQLRTLEPTATSFPWDFDEHANETTDVLHDVPPLCRPTQSSGRERKVGAAPDSRGEVHTARVGQGAAPREVQGKREENPAARVRQRAVQHRPVPREVQSLKHLDDTDYLAMALVNRTNFRLLLAPLHSGAHEHGVKPTEKPTEHEEKKGKNVTAWGSGGSAATRAAGRRADVKLRKPTPPPARARRVTVKPDGDWRRCDRLPP